MNEGSGKRANRAPIDLLTNQGLRTRGRLLREGRRLLETRGYHAVNIREITAAASVSTGTFYTYFDSKEQMFGELLSLLENEMHGDAAGQSQRDRSLPDTLLQLNHRYMDLIRRNARLWAAIEESQSVNEDSRSILARRRRYFRSWLQRALTDGQSAGQIDSEVDLLGHGDCLMAMTERCAFLIFVAGAGADADDVARRITSLWIRCLGVHTPTTP